MRAEQLSERFGVTLLTPFYESERFHSRDFNSDRARWLALGGGRPPGGSAAPRGRRGRVHRERSVQQKLWCAAPAAFSDLHAEIRKEISGPSHSSSFAREDGSQRGAVGSSTDRKSACRRRPR